MLDIASVAFEEISDAEKLRYQARIKETGTYLGYKLPQYWVRSERAPSSCFLINPCIAHRKRRPRSYHSLQL
jgi:hypothetical protein